VVLSCKDSRTSPELIFDQGLGDLFSIRVAGNVVGRDVLGSMEYAVAAAGAKLLLVLGHTACGAVAGACNGTELGHLTGLLEKIRPAIGKAPALNGDRQAWHDAVAEANVCLAIEEVRRRSPLVRERLDRGLLGLAGAMYNVGTGRVEVLHACAHVRQAAPGAAALL
jgi:carbonic anhydrase